MSGGWSLCGVRNVETEPGASSESLGADRRRLAYYACTADVDARELPGSRALEARRRDHGSIVTLSAPASLASSGTGRLPACGVPNRRRGAASPNT